MVQILGLVEGERTFSNLAFMKSKLFNKLTTHLDLCVPMFTQNVYNVSIFPYDAALVENPPFLTKSFQLQDIYNYISTYFFNF